MTLTSCKLYEAADEIDKLWNSTKYFFFKKLSPFVPKDKALLWEDKESEENIKRKNFIDLHYNKLNDLIEQHKITLNSPIDDVVRFFELIYRKTQLIVTRGLLCTIVGIEKDRIKYYNDAVALVDETLRPLVLRISEDETAKIIYWNSYIVISTALFATERYADACYTILSVPETINNKKTYYLAMYELKRMMPYLPQEILSYGKPAHGKRPATICYPVSQEIKDDLIKLAGGLSNIKYKNAKAVIASNEPIGHSVFISALCEIYNNASNNKRYEEKYQLTNALRSLLLKWAHFASNLNYPENTLNNRLAIIYYNNILQLMRPARSKRNEKEQYYINEACCDIFQNEMMHAIRLCVKDLF